MAFERATGSLCSTVAAVWLSAGLLAASAIAGHAGPSATSRAPRQSSIRVLRPQAETLDVAALTTILAEARARHRVPGMSTAVLQDGQLTVAANGLRQAKKAALVAEGDLWHLGSCGKAMTATLCARLVEKNVLTWDTTIAQVFPELQVATRPEYSNVTLYELLAHRGGFPEGLPKKLEKQLRRFQGFPVEAREMFLPKLLLLRPAAQRGSFHYSNVGYSLVGAMLERLTGYSYEELMELEVFGPLGMTTSGFGEPRRLDRPDQPAGHTSKGKPLLPGSAKEPPSAGSPAGLMHMTMADWSRFAAVHLDETGTSGYLTEATLRYLHRAFPGSLPQYALGWLRLSNGTDAILAHNGTNGYWFSLIALVPGRNLAVMVVCNQGGKKGEKATLAAMSSIAASLGIELPPVPAATPR